MIDRSHPLALSSQAQALGISRGIVYYRHRRRREENPNRDNCIRYLHRKHPTLSSRKLCALLINGGIKVTRHHIDRVIKAMKLERHNQPGLEPRRG